MITHTNNSAKWTASSEFVSSSIPSWQILTAHAQPFRGARDLAFCLKVPLDSLLVWASSEGSGETARMRRLAWTFAARIGDKYQIRLTRPKYFQSFMKSWFLPKTWYHAPSRSGSPDILFARLRYCTKCQIGKGRQFSQIFTNLPNVNQVIYTPDTICVPNIMILAQAVLQIFCSQGPKWVKCLSLKREIIQWNIDRTLWKVNQVIYTHVPKPYAWHHDPSSSGSPDILFTSLLSIQNGKVGKGS